VTDDQLPGIGSAGLDIDPARDEIAEALLRADPTGERLADVSASAELA
jgi:hypothetical protein